MKIGARIAALVAGVGMAALASGAAEAQQYRLMTGPQGGSWYPLGGAISQIAADKGMNVQVLPGAGIANVKGVQQGKAHLGFANSISTVDGVEGRKPFDEKADNVCNVATLYPQYFQVVSVASANIDDMSDFEGESFATQPVGNTGEMVSRHALQVAGVTYDDLSKINFVSYTDGVALMKDGNAVGMGLGTTVPASAILDLASAREIKMVGITDEQLAEMQEINAGYKRIHIPEGSYPGQDDPVPTVGYFTHIIAACDLDPDVVYNVLSGIVENQDDLAAIAKAVGEATVESMGRDVGVPMHKGAVKYYKEKGVM